jgi:hypothetical protein
MDRELAGIERKKAGIKRLHRAKTGGAHKAVGAGKWAVRRGGLSCGTTT